MKKRFVEYRWVVDTFVYDRKSAKFTDEPEIFPMLRRARQVRVLWIWFTLVGESHQRQLNDFIFAATMGDQFNYDGLWKKKSLNSTPDKIIYALPRVHNPWFVGIIFCLLLFAGLLILGHFLKPFHP